MSNQSDSIPTREFRIPAKGVKSLCWVGNELIDIAAGQVRYGLGGQIKRANVNYAYPFDAAIVSPSGDFAALFERFGTKAILIDLASGKILRELNRSFYQAHVYEYPILFFELPDKREVLAHCPIEYCRIEFEEVKSGQRLTPRASEPFDFFHSRLAATADGKWLLSAGWIWHPVDFICLFDVERVLIEPQYLDTTGETLPLPCEVNTASFLDSSTLLMATSEDAEVFDDEDENAEMSPAHLCRFGLIEKQFASRSISKETVGEMMPISYDRVVGFYGCPKVFDVSSGKVLKRWPDLWTGERNSSIAIRHDHLPILALDAAHRRFAVADKDSIVVVEFLNAN